jgi:hypothetical protein
MCKWQSPEAVIVNEIKELKHMVAKLHEKLEAMS